MTTSISPNGRLTGGAAGGRPKHAQTDPGTSFDSVLKQSALDAAGVKKPDTIFLPLGKPRFKPFDPGEAVHVIGGAAGLALKPKV